MLAEVITEAETIMIPGIAGDGSLYPIEKMKAHEEGSFHLAISAFVFDGDHLLIQRRADGKYHCGGLWANTCCTHPHWGEGIDKAASRRLYEELGISLELKKRRVVEYSADVGSGLHEHERVTIFVGNADRNCLVIRPNPLEVSETRWISGPELRSEMLARPLSFTPWFQIYLQRFPNLVF